LINSNIKKLESKGDKINLLLTTNLGIKTVDKRFGNINKKKAKKEIKNL